MGRFSEAWSSLVGTCRYSKWNTCGPREPVMPWISPSVPVCLARALKNIGATMTVEAGDEIHSSVDKLIHQSKRLDADKYIGLDNLIYVTKGIIARTPNKARTAGARKDALWITPPGRILGGGLDFFFCHPFSYINYAMVKSEIVICNKKLLMQILASDAPLNQTLQQQFELCNLSNSITLEALSCLPVQERLQLYLLSWAVYWGTRIVDDQSDKDEWIRIPTPLQRDDISRVIGASRAAVDKSFTDWRQRGVMKLESPYLVFRGSLIRPMLPWLCVYDDIQLAYRHDLDLEDIMPAVSVA